MSWFISPKFNSFRSFDTSKCNVKDNKNTDVILILSNRMHKNKYISVYD